MWEAIAKIIELVAIMGANSASTLLGYQPELPKQLRE